MRLPFLVHFTLMHDITVYNKQELSLKQIHSVDMISSKMKIWTDVFKIRQFNTTQLTRLHKLYLRHKLNQKSR